MKQNNAIELTKKDDERLKNAIKDFEQSGDLKALLIAFRDISETHKNIH